ncbi:MAG: zf-HC2 domain-containing protein [Acidobacteria bacterium]|nr:zf-HC2 domain-containing protein [Acidobacteriota bacterium]
MKTPEKNIIEGCDRKEDLIGYIYEELSAIERSSFERHLAGCPTCSEETRAFGRVRDDLSTWQVGFTPQTEFQPPRGKWSVFFELVGMFPFWARGVALAAAAMILATFSFGAWQMLTGGGKTPTTEISSAAVEAMIQEAVAKERFKLMEDFKTEMAGLKERINAENESRLQSVKADQDARIKTLQAGFQSELRKVNRQNSSIRSFFAMDDSQEPWGGTR